MMLSLRASAKSLQQSKGRGFNSKSVRTGVAGDDFKDDLILTENCAKGLRMEASEPDGVRI